MKYKIQKLILFVFIGFLLLGENASWALSESKDFKIKVRQMLYDKKFWDLEKLADQLRQEESFFSDGVPKLEAFYDGFGYKEHGKFTIEGRKFYIRLLEEWNDSLKNSATVKIALADGYTFLAWDYRGTGWSDSVTTRGADKFQESLIKAWQYLDEAEALNNNDPQLYAQRIIVGLGMGVPKVFFYEAVANSLMIFPGYSQTFRMMQIALLPRWEGEKGEVERFAKWVAAMTKDEYGDEMYAYSTCAVLKYVGLKSFDQHRFDLPRVNSAFKKMWARFPNMDDDLHCYAFMAVKGGNPDLAGEIFSKIKYDSENDTITRVWEGRNNFDFWKNAAESKVALPKDGPVLAAVKQGDLETLKKAVAVGGDMNERDSRGHSALMIAVENMSPSIAEYLIENGADLSYKNKDGEDVLNFAAVKGTESVVKLLLKKGVNTRRLYKNNWTALHYAVQSGSLNVVKELLSVDRDLLYLTDTERWTALHLAAWYGYEDIAEYLLELDKSLINKRIANQNTPLHLAAEQGHDPVVEVLLKYSVDISALNNLGETTLNSALKSNDMKIVGLLKEKGAREGFPITEEAWKRGYDHYVKGNNSYNASNWQETQKEMDIALQINPYYAGHYAVYAMLETHAYHNPQKGLEYVEKSLGLDPDYPYVYYAKARTLDALGRKDEALESFRKYIKLEPNSHLVPDIIAHYPSLK